MVAIPKSSTARKKRTPKKISWEVFEQKYLSKEDKYKYEWVDGYVEKTPRTMNKEQLYILRNLRLLFKQLDAKNAIDGLLIAEIDTFFKGNHRRPDVAYVTNDQIEAGKKREDVVPQFIVEIISTNDQMNTVHKKMDDYEAAGVQIVWHVFPILKKVHVYKGKQMTVCKGKDICSAESVIKGFKLSADQVFA